MNQLDLVAYWNQGDFISHFLTVVLLIMSVSSWSVMIVKAGKLLRLRGLAQNAQSRFWYARSWEEALNSLGSRIENPFYNLARAGEAATTHRLERSELQGKLDPSDWIARCLKDALDEHAEKTQSGMAVLASVGSTAPFVGLFGTVWGIYHALHVIGMTGQASLGQVAGPVGEALIMTALGLFVAIPAVLGYNAIARRSKSLSHKLHRFANDLHAYFLTGSRVELAQGNAAANDVRPVVAASPLQAQARG
ncbi:MAG: biopolymer transporter [Candidatus Dactylopiibacterium carminicum]|uniref:Biopolymer transport protein ExbB n=1 Tax=Candidatus Dactylopiibacterium carminicum TaxID=857335 RepID=A0A272EXS5_9RHOO|nr:MotA/TolQ/ExbB proton channel family protein [Candidatus Dactylopiibacterium carminicum]KAF7600507.1 MotA/TolQ/ExbB proton channel family protein [Candidatus Dactylopiibacterium carminicum]PAS94924.1 MAG: biopolymer transporter [Candidatus Dactylopiibacterium carminicum]PAS98061.1 MAG: biopolymer transporter [Candidatus Dactylopiibacterium carminicum]PAT00512.1 MAG: biopolymer transporter [Candidatus Dactylopiibacterium carminicum]